MIRKAIGDCVAGKNQFKCKSINDIITLTFKGIAQKEYEQEHWNAIILYNYIHEAINGEKDILGYYDNVSAVLGETLARIKDQYQANKSLDTAVDIIEHYVKALKLNEYLCCFRESKLQYDETQSVNDLAPQHKLIQKRQRRIQHQIPSSISYVI